MMTETITEAPAAHVVEAIARVMRDLPAIGKEGHAAPSQGGYAYRGIEQITRAAQGLFARHGITFVPRVTSYEVKEITVQNKPWTDTILSVDYRIYGPAGIDDYLTASIVAIGRDNSDKGANKAMTQAFKYVMLQTLCISDATDDTDGTTHVADASPVSQPAEADTVDDIRGQIGRLDATARATLADRWNASKIHNLDQLQADEVEAVREMLRAVAVESFRSASDTPAAPTAPAPASEALSEPLDASVVDADHQLAVARESVAGLPARGIDKALSDRALITSGGIEFRRERLAKALASEAAMPEVEG